MGDDERSGLPTARYRTSEPRAKMTLRLARDLILALLGGTVGAALYLLLDAQGLPVLSLVVGILALLTLLLIMGRVVAATGQALQRTYAWVLGLLLSLALLGLVMALWPGGRIMIEASQEGKDQPLAGLVVELRAQGEVIRRAVTDNSGRAAFAQLPMGHYELILAAPELTLSGRMPAWGYREYRLALRPTPPAQTNVVALPGVAVQVSPAAPVAIAPTQPTIATGPTSEPNLTPTPHCQEVLQDGAFAAAEPTAWRMAGASTSPIVCQSSRALSKPCLLVLGESAADMEAAQAVTLPPQPRSARLDFYYLLSSRAPKGSGDQFQIYLRDARTAAPLLIIATLDQTASGKNVYQHFVYEFEAEELAALSKRSGPVELVLRLKQKERLGTLVYLDDVSWQVCN